MNRKLLTNDEMRNAFVPEIYKYAEKTVLSLKEMAKENEKERPELCKDIDYFFEYGKPDNLNYFFENFGNYIEQAEEEEFEKYKRAWWHMKRITKYKVQEFFDELKDFQKESGKEKPSCIVVNVSGLPEQDWLNFDLQFGNVKKCKWVLEKYGTEDILSLEGSMSNFSVDEIEGICCNRLLTDEGLLIVF